MRWRECWRNEWSRIVDATNVNYEKRKTDATKNERTEMKIIYHINSLYNPGGMERVVLNKATWLDAHGYEVCIVTTDQDGRPAFYDFPKSIRMVDLGINYSADKGKNIFAHIVSYLKKKRLHKKRLRDFLLQEKAYIVDTLYPGESSFIPSIKDGSKKVIELHQSKFFHRQYANKGLKGLIDRWREMMDVRMVSRFDKFVVLTEEDRGYWGELPNIAVIPNAAKGTKDERLTPRMITNADATKDEERMADATNGHEGRMVTKDEWQMPRKTGGRVIAVGRLDYQKSFDRLIQVWELVCRQTEDWVLDIYGQGEWKEMLQQMIDERGLGERCHLRGTTNNIWKEYAESDMIVMTSHYEGLPMVMIEAMACGLPAVSFDFKCGPKDVIQQGVNGYCVKDGDIAGMAEAIVKVVKDDELRQALSREARKVAKKYSEESVMQKWQMLFDNLVSGNSAVK